MQLDELFLLTLFFSLFVFHLVFLAVSSCRIYGEKKVTDVPTDIRKVSTTIGFGKADSQDNE